MVAARQQDPGSTWRSAVFTGWAPRVVTLCSAAIRIVISAQGGLITAMLAAFLIERSGINLEQAPLLSIIRCLRVSPITLWFPWTVKAESTSDVLYSIAILIALLNTLASQFTSTILLFDFDTVTALGNYNTTNMPYGIPSLYPSYNGPDIWKSGASSYPRFAEHREPPVASGNFEDTGATMRALLPFPDKDDGRPSAATMVLPVYLMPGSYAPAQS